MVGGRRPLPSEICAQSDPPPSKNCSSGVRDKTPGAQSFYAISKYKVSVSWGSSVSFLAELYSIIVIMWWWFYFNAENLRSGRVPPPELKTCRDNGPDRRQCEPNAPRRAVSFSRTAASRPPSILSAIIHRTTLLWTMSYWMDSRVLKNLIFDISLSMDLSSSDNNLDETKQFNSIQRKLFQIATVRRVQRHTSLTHYF